MWKKCLAFAGVLGLIILLDPTPTPAQPGGFGGKGGRDRGGFGAPPGGGSFGQPGGGGTFVVQPGGGGAMVVQPGGGGFAPPSGGGGFGQPGGGFGGPGSGGFGGGRDRGSFGAPQDGGSFGGGRDRGGFGGSGPGSGSFGPPSNGSGGFGPPPSGGPGGGTRGGMDPERGWMMLQRLTNSTGETVDLGAIPPQTRDWLKGMTERMGGIPLPESGVWTKAQYLDHFTRSEAARASAASGNTGTGGDRMSRGPGGGWGGPGGFDPNNGGGWGGGWGDMQRPNEKKETEEERPVAMRYGKLPKDLPSWFEDYDTDKDGQVGLYEWRKASKAMAEFTAMDLNGDGFVTADEYLRFSRQENINTKIAAYEETGVKPGSGWGLGTAGPSSGGDTKGKSGPGGWGGPKGGSDGSGGKSESGGKGDRPDRGDKSEKGKGNPWMKRN